MISDLWTKVAIYRCKILSPNDEFATSEIWAEYFREEEGDGVMIEADSDSIRQNGWKPIILYRYERSTKTRRFITWETLDRQVVTQREDQITDG